MIRASICGLLGVFCIFLATSAVAAETGVASTNKKNRAPTLQIADLSGIEDWQAGGDKIVYIEDDKNQWYRVDLRQACMKLDTTKGVRFLTEVSRGSSRRSYVEVAYHQCRITGITKIDAPPPK